jgi:two-component system C4-dicarboxylate transport sensor histidine kinase DctB
VPPGTLSPAVRTLSESEMVFANRLVNLEQVLPNVTHELNNALQVISGLSEILSIRPDVSGDVAQKLQRMHAQSTRCYGLLHELLAYARRDDVKHVTDVGRAIDRALDLRRFHLSRAHVTVAIEPGPAGVVAAMDSQHFEQMLLNLMLNAEQAMAVRPNPTLTLRYAQRDDVVVISVADTGPGVDLSTVEATCFAPFWTSRPGMLGLGLPVARVLAAAARGTVAFVAPSRVEVRVPAR